MHDFLPSFLDGEAKRQCKKHVKDTREENFNFDFIVEDFSERFKIEKDPEGARSDLTGIKQGVDSLTVFARRVSEKADEAFPFSTVRETDEHKHYFLQGLKAPVKRQLDRLQLSQTLASFARANVMAERVLKRLPPDDVGNSALLERFDDMQDSISEQIRSAVHQALPKPSKPEPKQPKANVNLSYQSSENNSGIEKTLQTVVNKI